MWFITCPELIVAKLFSQKMKDNESIIVDGVLQFSAFEGSGNTFKFLGPLEEDAYRGPHTVVSMDALDFNSEVEPSEQFLKKYVDRELLKAFAGFSGTKIGTIATGNWGGGCFSVGFF